MERAIKFMALILIFISGSAIACDNEINTSIDVEGIFVSEVFQGEKEYAIWYVKLDEPLCFISIGSITKLQLDISERGPVSYLMVDNKKYRFIGTVTKTTNKLHGAKVLMKVNEIHAL